MDDADIEQVEEQFDSGNFTWARLAIELAVLNPLCRSACRSPSFNETGEVTNLPDDWPPEQVPELGHFAVWPFCMKHKVVCASISLTQLGRMMVERRSGRFGVTWYV